MLLAFGGVVVAALLLVLIFRKIVKTSSAGPKATSRGPTSMRFVCAGCHQQFTHTKRTVAAWEKGTRRLFCSPCHEQWLRSRPPQQAKHTGASGTGHQSLQSPPGVRASSRGVGHASSCGAPLSAESRGGCLGISLLIVLLPALILFVAKNA